MLDNFDEIEREPKIITYDGHFPEELGWKDKHIVTNWKNETDLLLQKLIESNSVRVTKRMGSLDHVFEEKDVDSFLDKLCLVFDVNTPNEEELNKVLKDEVNKTNWFNGKNNDFLTAEEQWKVLMKASDKMHIICGTALSIDYKYQRRSDQEKYWETKTLLGSLPKFTAVKFSTRRQLLDDVYEPLKKKGSFGEMERKKKLCTSREIHKNL